MTEFIQGMGWIILYFIVCICFIVPIRKKNILSDEAYRKTLHFIQLNALVVWMLTFQTWYYAVFACLLFAAICYPLLYFGEKIPKFSQAFNERRSGEIRSSLLQAYLMYAAVITICWGFMNDKMLAFISIFAWGYGDAAAALIGKRFGKHKFPEKIAGGKKSIEGTLGNFCVSFIAVFILLMIRGGMGVSQYIVTAAAVSAVSAFIELVTQNGFDTVTCPLGSMITAQVMFLLFGGIV